MPLVLDGTTGFNLPSGAEIGVGTNSPAGNGLHVDHTAGATLRLTRLGTSTSHFVQLETDGAHGTLRSEGDLTIDVASNIILDSDSGTVQLKDNGTEYVQFYKNGNNVQMTNTISDGDIIFRGNDGGSMTNALTLDISNLGFAFFNANAFFNESASDVDFRIKSVNQTNMFYVDASTNRIGIGTDAPAKRLDIIGNSTDYPLSLDSTNTDYAMEFRRNGASEWWLKASSTSFQIHENGVGDSLTVLSGGNVGIGETSPENILHIKTSAAGGPQIELDSTSGTANSAFINFDGTSLQLSTQRDMVDGSKRDTAKSWGGINIVGAAAGSYIQLQTSSGNNNAVSTKMTIDKDGNVGIGTDSPGAKLTITDENAGQASMQIRNFNTSATGSFTNNYNVEIRSATSTTTHGMLIHLNENNIGRRTLDIADSVGAQGDTVFASFVQGKVGINNTSPIGQLDIVVPQDKVPLVVRSGGKSNIGYNAGHVMHCHNSISSSGTWYDVCYVSHSPNIFILGSTVQDGSAHLGGSRWCSRMYGTYGSVAHTTFGGGTRTVAMNGGAITGMDYRYLNGGASSGSYRLQVYVTWSGSISSMEVYTTVIGNGADTLQEDN